PCVVHGHCLRDIGHQVAKTIVTLKGDLIGARAGGEAHRPIADRRGVGYAGVGNDPGYWITISVPVDRHEDVLDIDRGGPIKGNQVIGRREVIGTVKGKWRIATGGVELREYAGGGRADKSEYLTGGTDAGVAVGKTSGVLGVDH